MKKESGSSVPGEEAPSSGEGAGPERSSGMEKDPIMKEDPIKEAYNRGYNDHWQALRMDETGYLNPYFAGTPEAEAYDRGYTDAGQDW